MAVKALGGGGGGGGCDRVKLSLRLQGMRSDNQFFAVWLLVWLRHTMKEKNMKSDVIYKWVSVCVCV